ncbi:uncharacterized protein LOC131148015 [Malania oleifera]|uniref:uncharacterized protein LOC131148015 n=1 Tax=Malania oleifera TaxID=397392 RepID=UPI0025AE93BA|nr:uncharacterized protein LOC131148015 [Malania oleifera]
MSLDDSAAEETIAAATTKAHAALQSLSPIISSLPPSLSSDANPAVALLHDPDLAAQISAVLLRPDSGVGDDPLCRWLYDTFQSSDPALQLVVLRFLPTVAALYLSRVALRNPLAGFEAVLLALYAHETTARGGRPTTVSIPDLSHPSLYHESLTPASAHSTPLNMAVVSPCLEPHGTVRSTRRARIVGVALELYYSIISQMPLGSKMDFCEFCGVWAGQSGEEESAPARGGGRIGLPWELLQPVLRILGHCLLGTTDGGGLREAAGAACRRLYARALHDIDAKAILATQSLVRLATMAAESDGWDPTEIPKTRVISL